MRRKEFSLKDRDIDDPDSDYEIEKDEKLLED
jgi:hypothetical protein